VRRLAAEVLDATGGTTDPRLRAARARVLSCLGVLELYGGTYTRAAELLEEAAAVATGRLLLRMLSDLSLIYYNVDDQVRFTDVAERATTGADPADPEQAMLAAYLSGAAQVWAGRPELGVPLVRHAIELLESDPDLRDDPRHMTVAFFAALWLMDPSVALPYAERRLARAREAGALGMLAVGLTLAAGGLAWLGDHVRAYAFAGEAVELLSALGRAGRRIAARDHLRAARGEFVAMDLTLWAQRAADELAGTGERARRRDGSAQPLTSQETRVALLVAQGMTNREVAAALFLSPKTVEHHLGTVLRKRGLRSRTGHARAIAGEPPGD
jgi:DNA-binding CsgD family transcriptional regulator